jgi:hypothetical protein
MHEALPGVLRLLLIAAGLALVAPVQAIEPGITSRNDFDSEVEAARHCSGRPVVWVVPASHVYYFKSDPGYGSGRDGAYMCEDEASGDRNRPARDKRRAPR